MAEVGQRITVDQAWSLAIEEAKKGNGFVSPNPLVGCTIVDRDHRFLAVGYHARVGDNHAEIDALSKIGDSSKLIDATVYVTLEPCAHEGRTGSCAKALAKLPIKKVIYGLIDPFPLVAGKGAQILRDAGIETLSVDEDRSFILETLLRFDLEDLAEVFLHNVRKSEPFVAIKVATSSDGMMALKSGGQVWITGEKARAHVQLIRLGYDAVLIGRNTFETDNPSLNIRLIDRVVPANKVVLIDLEGKTLSKLGASNLLRVRPAEKILVLVREDFAGANPSGVKLLRMEGTEGSPFSADQILKALWAQNIRSVLIEGGAQTYTSFIREGKVHRLYHFESPKILGDQGVRWLEKTAQSPQLEHFREFKFGDDVLITGPIRDAF